MQFANLNGVSLFTQRLMHSQFTLYVQNIVHTEKGYAQINPLKSVTFLGHSASFVVRCAGSR